MSEGVTVEAHHIIVTNVDTGKAKFCGVKGQVNGHPSTQTTACPPLTEHPYFPNAPLTKNSQRNPFYWLKQPFLKNNSN